MSFLRAVKLISTIRDRRKNEFVNQIMILSTALMEGKDRKDLIEEIQRQDELNDITSTNFDALDKIKSQMK